MNLYQQSEQLYARYPEAVRPVNVDGSVQSMVLMLAEAGAAQFFVLARQCGVSCTLFRWHEDGIVTAGVDGTIAEQDQLGPAEAGRIAGTALPLPGDGSLYGWLERGALTALIPFYIRYTPESPDPTWSVMPRAGMPESQWPPFTGEHLFGPWFWDNRKAGRIVDVGAHLPAARRSVWWVDTRAALGWDSCAVARDVKLPHGVTLPRGLYTYYQSLRDGAPVPSLEEALATRGKTDLACRFAEAA